MPYMWVDPEEFLNYQGKIIYHSYKNEDFEQPLSYWYSTDLAGNHDFDIRELPDWSEGCDEKQVVIHAIRDGQIKFEEEE